MTIYEFVEKEFGHRDSCNVVEVGAHVGTDTVQLFDFVKQGQLLVYEPDPRNLPILKEKIGQITNNNITLLEKAVGASNGQAKFYLSSGTKEPGGQIHTASSSIKEPKNHCKKFPWVKFEKEVNVEIVTLDTSCPLDIIDLLWIDVQGAEMDVIKGGQNTLSKTKFVFTEFNDGEMYRDQAGLSHILDSLPGDWGIVKIFGDEILLQNRAFGSKWIKSHTDNLSIVMQGPILECTDKAVESIREWFPNAELILSTWTHEKTFHLNVDHRVRIEDPGGGSKEDYDYARGNMKRLFLGCSEGIKVATHDLVMKIRTDTIFTGNDCLSHVQRWPKRDPSKMRVFNQRIVVPNIGTADPEVHICFQITDWVMIGNKYELYNLFNAPLGGIESTNNSPEQYMWLNTIQKTRPDLSLSHINEKSPEVIVGTIEFMTNNLIILDTKEQFNFYSGKYPDIPDDHPVNMRHKKWAQWYGGMQ